MSDPFLQRDGEQHQEYLGDAVYAAFDGFQVWLRTGEGNRQEIALDANTLNRLFEYVENLKRLYNSPVPPPSRNRRDDPVLTPPPES